MDDGTGHLRCSTDGATDHLPNGVYFRGLRIGLMSKSEINGLHHLLASYQLFVLLVLFRGFLLPGW